jgi:hypothetical protein
MAADWLYDLQGKEVVFTGENDGYEEDELADLALELGARRVSDDCNLTTNVLVRGHSDRWKFGTYGKKEAKAAQMQAAGRDIVIIDLAGLLSLAAGLAAPVLPPNAPVAPAREPATAGGAFGAPYRAGRHQQPVEGDGAVFRDPDNVERGLRAHSTTQDQLAALIEEAGYEPASAFDRSCNFDIGWRDEQGTVHVAEVKSLTDANESFQIRHGLGQVLDYAHRLNGRGFPVRPLLVLERRPQAVAHWTGLCNQHGVSLVWAPGFAGVLTG